MKLFKSIIAGFLSIAITISLTIPAFAVDSGVIVSGMAVAPDFGSWLWDTAKTAGNLLAGFIDNDNYCPGAETSLNGRHSFVPQHTQVNGKTGMFYICQNCGKSAGEVLEPIYDDYVSTLPASGCTSTGHLIWQPTLSDVEMAYVSNSSCYPPWSNGFSSLPSGNGICRAQVWSGNFWGENVNFNFIAPCPGSYCTVGSLACNYYASNSDKGKSDSGSLNYPAGVWFVTDSDIKLIHVNRDTSGSLMRVSVSFGFGAQYARTEWYFPVFEVVPSPSFSGDTYSTTTRPASITGGNYGIVGDNGQITKVEDNSTIVNETNNTYYNPATGQSVPITGWSYDYSDRSYKVTMEGGKTSTITYGDENISITEITVSESGDTVTNNYTIYYLIDGSASETPPCEHAWTETSTTPATCTMPGSKLSTCSKCQQTKKETIPALGHNWQVKQTVTTQYDEEGNLTQQGYTIFECSRCHEQYKSTDGTIPPGGGSGTDPGDEEGETTIGSLIEKLLSGVGSIVGGIIKGLLSLLTKAVEALAGLAELFTTFVGSLVELWGGFTSFLSAVFPFLPEEFVIIIELGLILMIAAAVFRKFIS